MTRILAALAVCLASASTAMAHWGHYSVAVAIPVAPPVVAYAAPTVTYYAPAAPVVYPTVPATYLAPVPTVTYYAPAPAPVVYAAPPVAYAAPLAYVPGRYSVKFYPYGQPVRNVIRAVLP